MSGEFINDELVNRGFKQQPISTGNAYQFGKWWQSTEMGHGIKRKKASIDGIWVNPDSTQVMWLHSYFDFTTPKYKDLQIVFLHMAQLNQKYKEYKNKVISYFRIK